MTLIYDKIFRSFLEKWDENGTVEMKYDYWKEGQLQFV